MILDVFLFNRILRLVLHLVHRLDRQSDWLFRRRCRTYLSGAPTSINENRFPCDKGRCARGKEHHHTRHIHWLSNTSLVRQKRCSAESIDVSGYGALQMVVGYHIARQRTLAANIQAVVHSMLPCTSPMITTSRALMLAATLQRNAMPARSGTWFAPCSPVFGIRRTPCISSQRRIS